MISKFSKNIQVLLPDKANVSTIFLTTGKAQRVLVEVLFFGRVTLNAQLMRVVKRLHSK